MAENETLDLMGRNSGRWRHVWRLIRDGASDQQVCEKAIRNLYTTFRKLYEDIPVAAMLRAAAGENGDLEELVRNCRKHRDYAELFPLEARQGFDRETVVANVCTAAVERFLDQIGLEMMQANDGLDFGECADGFSRYKSLLKEPIQKLARQLARNPDTPPRRPAVPKQERERRHKELLATSLLEP